MKYVVEQPLDHFDAWSGGLQTLRELIDHPKAYNYIENFIDEWTYDNDVSETSINDFLWFDAFDYLAEVGLYDNENGVWLDEDEEE